MTDNVINIYPRRFCIKLVMGVCDCYGTVGTIIRSIFPSVYWRTWTAVANKAIQATNDTQHACWWRSCCINADFWMGAVAELGTVTMRLRCNRVQVVAPQRKFYRKGICCSALVVQHLAVHLQLYDCFRSSVSDL